jgi:hypothetical protein
VLGRWLSAGAASTKYAMSRPDVTRAQPQAFLFVKEKELFLQMYHYE